MGQASGQVNEALSLARQLAMTTYRGSTEFGKRFAGGPEFRDGRFHFPVEDYLEHAGRRFVEHFDADRFLALSESIDLHDIAPELVPVRSTLIGFPSDRLVPFVRPVRAAESAARVRPRWRWVDSPYGHDAFLKEPEQLAPLLRGALN